LHRRTFVRALTGHGKNDIRCDTVPDPKIEHDRDAIIKVTTGGKPFL
jgi:threonine dehydrogenase-like Zn-dependent dehydrogenase